MQDATKVKKDKDGGGQEGTSAAGVADNGVPTIVVINAGTGWRGRGAGGARGCAGVRPCKLRTLCSRASVQVRGGWWAHEGAPLCRGGTSASTPRYAQATR